MPQDPLLIQLASRCRTFSAGTNISLHKIARLIGTEPSNFNSFINGHCGLSARTTIKLLQLLNCSKYEIEMKLGRGAKQTGHIEHLQEQGRRMTLDDGGSWTPGDPSAGSDPVDSTSITETNTNPARSCPDDDELEFLAGLAGLHQQIIDRIDARQARAKVNPEGSTESARTVGSNQASRSAGTRPIAYPSK